MQVIPIAAAPAGAAWPSVGLAGTVITIGETPTLAIGETPTLATGDTPTLATGDTPTLAVDAAQHQRDCAVAVPVWRAGAGAGGGYSLDRPPQGCAYVAVIELPPRRYLQVETAAVETVDETAVEGEAGAPATAWIPEPQPIDMAAVRVRLWPLSPLTQEP